MLILLIGAGLWNWCYIFFMRDGKCRRESEGGKGEGRLEAAGLFTEGKEFESFSTLRDLLLKGM